MTGPKNIADPCGELLPFYLNQTLSPTDRREVETHLLTCHECQEALGEWSRLSQSVRQHGISMAAPPPLSPLVRLNLQSRPSLSQAVPSAWHLVWAQRVYLWRGVSIPALCILVVVGILASLALQTNAQEWAVVPLFIFIPIVSAALTALLYAVEDDDAYEIVVSTPTPLTILVFARLTLVLGILVILALLGSVLVAILGGGSLLQIVAAWLAPMLWLSSLTTLLSIVWRPRPAAGLALIIWGGIVILLVRELSGTPLDGITLRPMLQPGLALAAGQLLFAGLLLLLSWLWMSISTHSSEEKGLG